MPPDIRLSPVGGAPRRKNGRQQACEPCRRRKVACDHRLPICSRCRRSQIPEKCVYLTSERLALAPLSPSPSCCQSLIVVNTPELTVDTSHTTSTLRSDGSTGFLGATSFLAFYQESQRLLLNSESQPCLQQPSNEVYSRTNYTPPVLVELATRTLRSIPDEAFAKTLLEFDVNAHDDDGWCRLVGERLHASFWSVFGNHLNGDRNDSSMMHLATKINENTTKPFKDNETDPNKWIKSFSGSAMRWEALGHLFVYWAFGASHTPRGILNGGVSSSCRDVHASSSLELMRRYKKCASWCIELSRVARSSNALLLFLVFKHCLLESQISGETSLEYWRVHSDVLSLVTFMGLHASTNTDPNDRSISVQIHRRLFAAIFSHDITAATFTGRPPFLSRKYVSTPLPLDIGDEELLEGARNNDSQSLRLDANGWNINGTIYGVTFPRCRITLALIKDEILEIALQSQHCCYDGTRTLMNLKERAIEVMTNIPATMVYRPEDITSKIGVNNRNIVNKLRLRLDYLQNIFLIERLLNNQEDYSCDLFDISLEIISLALILWTHQKRVDYPETCLDWLVMSYAAPAGGVLCVQLLKYNTTTQKKAAIIEKLSMLVNFLDWVAPSAPHYDIGKGVQHAVRRTIKQSLEQPVSGTAEAIQDASVSWVAEPTEDFDDIFNFDLDTFDYDKIS